MLNYRTAQTADLPAMMKMVEEAKEGFRARNIDQWQKGEPNEQGLTEGIEKSVVHVLEENGEVLGMITVVPGPEADYAVIDGAWLNDEPYFAFHRVCVSEAHKGKGLAASLFSYSEAFAKERVSETFVSTPIRTISPWAESISQKWLYFLRKDHIMVPEAKPEIPGSPTRKF